MAVSVLLYRRTIRTLTKRMEVMLDGNYARMLRVVLNGSWKQHPTKQHLDSFLPPISHNHSSQTRKTRGAQLETWGWTHERLSIMNSNTWTHRCWPTVKNFQQPEADTGCCQEYLPKAINDRDEWRERERERERDSMVLTRFLFMHDTMAGSPMIDNLHQHQVTLTAWISLTLLFHPIPSSIATSCSSKLHPVSAQSWCK